MPSNTPKLFFTKKPTSGAEARDLYLDPLVSTSSFASQVEQILPSADLRAEVHKVPPSAAPEEDIDPPECPSTARP